MLQVYSMTLVSVIRCIGVDIVLSHSAFNGVRFLSDVRIEGKEFLVDVTDEVESVIWTSTDDTHAFLKLEAGLEQAMISLQGMADNGFFTLMLTLRTCRSLDILFLAL